MVKYKLAMCKILTSLLLFKIIIISSEVFFFFDVLVDGVKNTKNAVSVFPFYNNVKCSQHIESKDHVLYLKFLLSAGCVTVELANQVQILT